MKQFEFQATLSPDATFKIPAEVMAQIEYDQPVHVVVLVPERQEDRDWATLTTDQFLQGYADSDAVCDELRAG